MNHSENASEDPRLRNVTSGWSSWRSRTPCQHVAMQLLCTIPAGRKICASLILQQLLYYQFYYSWAWITFWVVWLFYKVCACRACKSMQSSCSAEACADHSLRHHAMPGHSLQTNMHWHALLRPRCVLAAPSPCTQYWDGLTYRDDDIVRTVLMVFWLLAEPIRLAAGWYGNLQENVGVHCTACQCILTACCSVCTYAVPLLCACSQHMLLPA